MTSHDRDFDDKAVDICALYLRPEEHWAVFSIDEKTGIQAKSRTNPTLVSGGREPPPPALLEPYVTVSRHTAPTVRRWVEARRCQ